MLRRVSILAAALALFGLTPGAALAYPPPPSPADLADAVYQRYLGRKADPGGVDVWAGRMRAGANPIELEAEFLGNLEYYKKAGDSREGYIQALYRDLLDNPTPRPDDVRTWARYLNRLGGDSQARVKVAAVMMKQFHAGVVKNYLRRRDGRGPRRDLPPPRP